MYVHPIAKINLGLNITEKRLDGFHNLETVFYPIPLQDVLEINQLQNSNEDYLFQLAGNKIDGVASENLVVKVYLALQKEFNLPPLDIYLYKHIPIGAGLGGGSSDAAEMMKLINNMFSLGLSNSEMEKRIAPFGADCSFFIEGKPTFATGKGDVFEPVNLSLKGWYLILVKPTISVSTADAYTMVTPRRPIHSLKDTIKLPVEAWRDAITNDFETSVFDKYPAIAAIKATLYDMGAKFALMSGSGSSVFGLFKNPFEDTKEIFKDSFVFNCKL